MPHAELGHGPGGAGGASGPHRAANRARSPGRRARAGQAELAARPNPTITLCRPSRARCTRRPRRATRRRYASCSAAARTRTRLTRAASARWAWPSASTGCRRSGRCWRAAPRSASGTGVATPGSSLLRCLGCRASRRRVAAGTVVLRLSSLSRLSRMYTRCFIWPAYKGTTPCEIRAACPASRCKEG